MARDLFINTVTGSLETAVVVGVNRPNQHVPLREIVAGTTEEYNLYLVDENGDYDSRSGDESTDIEVAISPRNATASSGTFTISDGVDTSDAIPFSASAQVVEVILNAMNDGDGADSDLCDVVKLNDGQWLVTWRTAGDRTALTGLSVDLTPESVVNVSESIGGSGTVREQQIIEINRQPAIFQDTWSTITNGFNATLAANTGRLQQAIGYAPHLDAYFEVRVDGGVVCSQPIRILQPVGGAASVSGTQTLAPTPEVRGIQFDTDNPDGGSTAGLLRWNDTDKTLDLITGVSDTILQIGQEVYIRARNSTGATLDNGTVVRVDGATGNRPTVVKAQADSVANASGILGIVTSAISNNADGFICIAGLVRGIDTSAYDEGDMLYLDASTAGEMTDTEPTVGVQVAMVTRVNPSVGEIVVLIDSHLPVYSLASNPTGTSGFSASAWRTALGVSATVSAPASASASGTAGQTAYDSNYFYVCTATNTWKRTPLATWS